MPPDRYIFKYQTNGGVPKTLILLCHTSLLKYINACCACPFFWKYTSSFTLKLFKQCEIIYFKFKDIT